MALVKSFLLLLISVCFINVNSYEYVPVYMWETSKNYSPLPSLGRINEEFFRDILLDKLNKDKTVLVFIEENLSPEDFTTYDSAGNSVFYSLSQMKSDAQVNYYPFVEAPLKALENLPGVKVTNVEVTSDGLPPNTNAEPGEVLIIDLNDAKENEDRSHMLSRHDSLIASIYKSFASKKKNIITLYTARHSSWLVPSELEENVSSRKARHLLADETAAVTTVAPAESQLIIKTDYVLLYASPYPTITKDNKTTILNECTNTVEADGGNTTLSLNCDGTMLVFEFKERLGYWSLETLLIDSQTNFTKVNVFAPVHFSYHCTKTQFSNDKLTLTWPNFQVEVAGNISKFSEAYDCVGFTSAPIWSGLFVTFILASIMTFGLCMILDIKTMDRFDDPKGKTISINVVE